jgi:hypothetical protein
MQGDAYYIRDSGEILCDTCAGSTALDVATDMCRHGWRDEGMPRPVRAAIVLASREHGGEVTPRRVSRILDDSRSAHYSSPRWSELADALSWWRNYCADVSNDMDSPNGEYCGGCSAELAAPWCEC